MSSHLDPLPADYENLVSKSRSAHTTNLSNVSAIISRLELAKSQLDGTRTLTLSQGESEPAPSASDTLLPLSSFIKQGNSQSLKEMKEWGNTINKLSKSVDKKFPGPPPPLFPSPSQAAAAAAAAASSLTPSNASTLLHPNLLSLSPSGNLTSHSSSSEPETFAPFSSPSEISALNSTIALHLSQIGAFDSLSTFLEESQTVAPLSTENLEELKTLHGILKELKLGNCRRAIEWVVQHKERDENGDLEFGLRKEEFIRILLDSAVEEEETTSSFDMQVEQDNDTTMTTTTKEIPHRPRQNNIQAALNYGGTHFRHLLTPSRTVLICSLLTSPLYMPLPKLLSSPYSHIFAPYASKTIENATTTSELCRGFSRAYLQSIGLPTKSALAVVTDVGGSGAMGKIMKVRNVMKEKRTEWSAQGELPVEIPLPISYRYHSIFTCPVSKEQSTEKNPPMLLPCGHCIAKESLMRLARGTPTLKCPYCPIVSHVNACIRVHF